MRGRLRAAVWCALLATTMTVGATAASATPPSLGHIYLTVHQGENTAGPVLGTVELWCDGDGGTHPDPAAACAALDATNGDVAAIPSAAGTCTAQYDPVTAVAQGYWAGGERQIDFTRSYGNRCALRLAKGPLFDF